MKKAWLRLLALVLAVAMLAGCQLNMQDVMSRIHAAQMAEGIVCYSDMVYTRPDMTQLRRTLNDACEAAKGEDLDAIVEGIWAYYEAYDTFYTNYALADIRYSGDLTDIYWEAEYNYCMENCPEVDAGLESLYYALADSPCRAVLEREDYFGDGYFDGYEGENGWDDTFTALLEQEAQLENRYYELSTIALDYAYGSESFYENCGEEMARLLVELIAVRQEMAVYWGYSDYASFADDFYYYRDYTPDQAEAYLQKIQQQLVPLYVALDPDVWGSVNRSCTGNEVMEYVRTMAQAMDGTVADAFWLMEEAGLYDIRYGVNKYNSSFEIYLTNYYEPFIFMNPSGTRYDCLTFAHEFGHFCNDYASYGSYAGIDVAEFFSQGMEYLSLHYAQEGWELTGAKMADSLCVYVEQGAFAAFEYRMYKLTGENLTVENLYRLYDQVAKEFGFESVGYDPREFVSIPHYFTSPMYIISYVVSNDAAMQLYQLEQAQPGGGLEVLQENLDTQEAYFLAFVESAGLENPMTDDRISEVKQIFQEILEEKGG